MPELVLKSITRNVSDVQISSSRLRGTRLLSNRFLNNIRRGFREYLGRDTLPSSVLEKCLNRAIHITPVSYAIEAVFFEKRLDVFFFTWVHLRRDVLD